MTTGGGDHHRHSSTQPWRKLDQQGGAELIRRRGVAEHDDAARSVSGMAVIGKTIAELGIAEFVELVRCQIERYRRELAALPEPAPLERPSSPELEGDLAEEAAYRAVEAVYGPPRPKFPRARKPLSFEARARRRCPSPAVAAVTGLQQPAFLGSCSHDVSEGASRRIDGLR